VGYVVWKQRRRRDRPKGEKGARAGEVDPTLEAAAALYRALEAALAARGVRRLASTPPLRHALALRETKHPLADEVVDLTNIYLAARFGGTENRRRDDARFLAACSSVEACRAGPAGEAALDEPTPHAS